MQPDALRGALAQHDGSARLEAALAAGTYPEPTQVEVLVERCAVEPDFQVREMLTWALVRHDAAQVLPLVHAELGSSVSQARSQALHTLSKIGDRASWAALESALLHDADDETARAAWRAAVVLVPLGQERGLIDELAQELGRGGPDVQRSLSRALVELGDGILPALAARADHADPAVRAHALATEGLLRDPESSFAGHLEDAKRAVIERDAPLP